MEVLKVLQRWQVSANTMKDTYLSPKIHRVTGGHIHTALSLIYMCWVDHRHVGNILQKNP